MVADMASSPPNRRGINGQPGSDQYTIHPCSPTSFGPPAYLRRRLCPLCLWHVRPL
jgi:hypothetical protein